MFKRVLMKRTTVWTVACICILAIVGSLVAAGDALAVSSELKVHSSGRYLTKSGSPFLWSGDTAWTLALNMNRSEVQTYLNDAKNKGFNVILMFTDAPWALNSSNRTKMGYSIYNNKDARQLNSAHFNHVAWVIDQAYSRGIYTVLVIGNPAVKASFKNNSSEYYNLLNTNAKRYTYGRKLGAFFRSRNNKIIWGLSQDEPVDRDPFIAGWNAVAEGIADGVNGANSDQFNGSANYATTLMTFHGSNTGGSGSASGRSQSNLKNRPWLDLYATYANNKLLHNTAMIHYNLTPRKPSFEIETRYESRTEPYGSWTSFWKNAADVYGGNSDYLNGHETRTHIYQVYQAGHMGYTYGHDEIFPFAPLAGYKSNGNWRTALNADGRTSMIRAKTFYNSIGWTKLRPDQSVIASGIGSGINKLAGAYTSDGLYTTVYFPVGNVSRTIRFNRISTSHANVEAKWFNPANGNYSTIGTYPRSSNQRSFTSPSGWTGAMLVLKGVGGSSGGGTPPPGGDSGSGSGTNTATSYEAESGTLRGAARLRTDGAASGGKTVDYIGSGSANTLTINNINTGKTGSQTMTIYYNTASTRTLYISVNGGSGKAISGFNNGKWSGTPATKSTTVSLNSGNNSIKFYNNSNYAPIIDRITFSGGSSGGGTPPPGGDSGSGSGTNTATAYEAESGSLKGAARLKNDSAASGGKMVDYIGKGSANTLTINNINTGKTGSQTMTIYYNTASTRTLYISVNGGSGKAISGFNNGKWSGTPATKSTTVSLNSGNNSIKFYNNSNYAPIIDRITFSGGSSGGGTPPPGGGSSTISREAESGTRSGKAIVKNCSGCSGGKLVDWIGAGSANTLTLNNVSTGQSGTHTLKIYYHSGNTRTLYISVNGGSGKAVSGFNNGKWTGTPATKTTTINLNSGNNTIKFYNNGSGTANLAPLIDRITLTK